MERWQNQEIERLTKLFYLMVETVGLRLLGKIMTLTV